MEVLCQLHDSQVFSANLRLTFGFPSYCLSKSKRFNFNETHLVNWKLNFVLFVLWVFLNALSTFLEQWNYVRFSPLSHAGSRPQLSVTLLPDCRCFISLEDTHPHDPWAPAKVSLLSHRMWFGSHGSSQRYIWVSDFLKLSTKLNSATELLSLWFPLAKREKSVTTLKSHIPFQPAISKEIFLKQEATGIHSWG